MAITDQVINDQVQTVSYLRSRAARVRELMMELSSQENHDRLRAYADELESKATQLERRGGQGASP